MDTPPHPLTTGQAAMQLIPTGELVDQFCLSYLNTC